MSKKVMVIRHAEKPLVGKVNGVRARGEIDDASLAPLGWQRSGALVKFFEHPTDSHIARPDHLFATRYDLGDVRSSRRPKRTLRAMSQAFGVRINDSFGKEQEPALAIAMAKLEGAVLVSWSHENILKISSAMGVHCALPDEWPDDRFDLVWVFDGGRTTWKFTQVMQHLLAGDSTSACPVAPAR